MGTANVFAALAIALGLALAVVVATGATPRSLELLSSLKLEGADRLEKRCIAYEDYLWQSAHGVLFATKSRRQLFEAVIESSIAERDEALSSGEKRVLGDLRECFVKLADQPAPVDSAKGASAAASVEGPKLAALSSAEVSSLSRIYQTTKSLSVEERCSIFHEGLRSMLVGQEAPASELFRLATEALGQRKLPFGNSNPVLGALQQCAAQAAVRDAPLADADWSATGDRVTVYDLDYHSLAEQNKEFSARIEALERELSAERERSKASTLAALNGVQSSGAEPRERARFEEMKTLYQQAAEREQRTQRRLEIANRRIEELKSKFGPFSAFV